MLTTTTTSGSMAGATVLAGSRFAANKYGPVNPLSGQRDFRLKIRPVDIYSPGMPPPRGHQVPRCITHSVCVVGRSQPNVPPIHVFILSDGHPQCPQFLLGSAMTSWFLSFRCRFLHFEDVGCDALNFVNLDGAHASTV